jgi:hypothetical protein
LLLNDLKDKDKVKSDRKDSDEDSSLYELIRGVPTVIIKSNGDEFDNCVPQRELVPVKNTCQTMTVGIVNTLLKSLMV